MHAYAFIPLTLIRQDRGKLTQEHLLEPAPEEEEVESDEDSTEDAPRGDDAEVWSAKVSQLIELLKVQPWDSKSLVFSQFTSYLDLVSVKRTVNIR